MLVECGRSGGAVQEIEQGGTTGGGRLAPGFRMEINEVVAGDFEEPGAEFAALGVGGPAFDSAGDGEEDILDEFAGVGVLEGIAAGEAVDEGLVNGDEFQPREAVLRRGEPENEAGSGFWK